MVVIGSGVLLGAALLLGQAASPPPEPQPVDCSNATHRAIGYWVGEWSVYDAASAMLVAESRIEWVVDGCAIRETYTQSVGPGGKAMHYSGTSHTAYDTAGAQWKQFYVDTAGKTVLLVGHLQDGRLVMSGESGGRRTRMTVEALPTGNVRQHGEFSTDEGKHWVTSYDFDYRRK